ncbi:MAG: LON peptidase substrate-binding domain-containing protein [Chloroflexi bacterium]|nr:LON peptidase substrate-binding domain-containing protein [Chloroflexota bacterium]
MDEERALAPAGSEGLVPLFPLDNVLFPDMLMPLHIFEPRYRLPVRRSIEKETPFGIVLIQEGEEVGPAAVPHRIGTLAAIVAHAPLPDGRFLITVQGDRRFEIDSVIDDEEPYLLGRVRYFGDPPEEAARSLANTVAEAYADYVVGVVAATGGVRREVPVVDEIQGGSPCDVSFRIAAGLAIEDDERQMLLETATARERLVREREILARECALLSEMLVRMRARGEGPTLH